MKLEVRNEMLFPAAVRALLQSLHGVGSFEASVLVGSWVMPVFGDLFGVAYPLRTMDIDFGVQLVAGARRQKADLQTLLTGLGYLPTISQSGLQRFTREGFTVEFLSHRKGGRDEGALLVHTWNITALPLPFLDILLRHAFWADFGTYGVRAPLPEAFFVQKLIVSQRRPQGPKWDKDLEQCRAVARRTDPARLRSVISNLKLSKQVRKALFASCNAIGFPPQDLGID